MIAFDANDEAFMRRAIDLAMRGRGAVEPNPMVGCLIVRAGKLIGEGYHRKFGQAHAEPNALANCVESPAGATAYVTLEPCCHLDKKTPPCVPELIEAKIARVVIGCLDPNPRVTKQCSEKLRAAGIHVDIGCLESKCRQLIAPFFTAQILGRPYITLKWAQTADGKVAGSNGARLQISNQTSTRIVHELRSRCDGILVGINTVLADDPLLTARVPNPLRRPVRIVLDRDLRIPGSSRLLHSEAEGPVRILYGERGTHAETESANNEIVPVPLDVTGQLSLTDAIRTGSPMTHLLVEPGPTLARSFLDSGLVDRVWVIRSPMKLGVSSAPAAAPVLYPPIAETNLAGDTLIEYLNPKSPAYFGPFPSADFRLAQ